MKPVIIVTVYRRYLELYNTIMKIKELSSEFEEQPDIIVIWSQPEVSRLWLFQKLLSNKLINNVVSRLRLDGEDSKMPTTYPESHNINIGLKYVKDNYDSTKTYAILQCCDIQPKPKTYFLIDQKMKDHKAVVFHWANGCVQRDIWHTNFFAVCLNEEYWPPISKINNADVLERQWGIHLSEKKLPDVFESSNYEDKRFCHSHISEKNPEMFHIAQHDSSEISFCISGRISWWKRLWCKLFKKRTLSRRKCGKN